MKLYRKFVLITRPKVKAALSCLFLMLLAMISCEKAEDLFSNYPAYFVFTPATQAPELYTALNSAGEFCTIIPNGERYVFASPKTSTTVQKTAVDQHVSVVLGLDGLIVGLPNIPEMGYDVPRVVCYDLCCPNCYRDLGITRRMQLQVGCIARCARCTREYDLNNLGIIRSDTTGISLFRYRVYYNAYNYTLTVSNR